MINMDTEFIYIYIDCFLLVNSVTISLHKNISFTDRASEFYSAPGFHNHLNHVSNLVHHAK